MHSPIIIIGAGRSGTNILRDSICSIEGFATWPCDEINYIWRHGNITRQDDRFTAKEARTEVKKFIRRQFKKLEKRSRAAYLVEKTCANSLKIPFIDAVFPDAIYIFLVRDGRDVASSAKQRWTAPLDMRYIFRKLKYVPLVDIPYYGTRYFINRVKKLFSKEKRLAFWGPVYPGMKNDLQKDTLLEVCAKQWRECVEIADSDLHGIDPKRVYKMRYENFVAEPLGELKKLMDFIGAVVFEEELQKATSKISPRSVNNYKKHISEEELTRINKIVEPAMKMIHAKID